MIYSCKEPSQGTDDINYDFEKLTLLGRQEIT